MTDVLTIDVAVALELLERMVASEGANTTRECKYVVDGVPHCIVACLLTELGVPRTTLSWNEGRSIHALRRYLDRIVFTDGAIETLYSAQRGQDDGKTWGEAVEQARDEAQREGWT